MTVRESELQSWIVDAAEKLGWLVFHPHDSRRSTEGYPDLTLVRHRILHRELKVTHRPSAVTIPQRQWLHRIRAAGGDADVWTLADWPGQILAELRATEPGPARVLPFPAPTAAEVAEYRAKHRAHRIRRR